MIKCKRVFTALLLTHAPFYNGLAEVPVLLVHCLVLVYDLVAQIQRDESGHVLAVAAVAVEQPEKVQVVVLGVVQHDAERVLEIDLLLLLLFLLLLLRVLLLLLL